MNNSTKNWIIAILFLIVLTGVFVLGYSRYPILHPITTSTDTVYVYDTVEHHIVDSFPFYVIRRDSVRYRDQHWMDSVLTEAKKDSAELNTIFREYYSYSYYHRVWSDSLVTITVDDQITENRPEDNNFKYKLLQPTVIVDNSTKIYNYAKYIYLGGSVSLPDSKYSNVGVYGAFPKTFAGISYMPWQKGAMFTVGIKIAKIK